MSLHIGEDVANSSRLIFSSPALVCKHMHVFLSAIRQFCILHYASVGDGTYSER